MARLADHYQLDVREWPPSDEADRGLLDARRDALTWTRLFEPEQVERGHQIVALRHLDFSLERITQVLNSSNPVQAFGDLWSLRRNDTSVLAAKAEDARAALGQAPAFTTREREQPGTLILTSSGAATLTELPDVIGRTALLFSVLRQRSVAVTAHVYAEYLNRATDLTPGSIRVCVPVAQPMRPAEGTALEVAAADRSRTGWPTSPSRTGTSSWTVSWPHTLTYRPEPSAAASFLPGPTARSTTRPTPTETVLRLPWTSPCPSLKHPKTDPPRKSVLPGFRRTQLPLSAYRDPAGRQPWTRPVLTGARVTRLGAVADG